MQIYHSENIEEPNNLKVWELENKKDISRVAKIVYDYICLRTIERRFNNNGILESKIIMSNRNMSNNFVFEHT
jgi:hypothetical protein